MSEGRPLTSDEASDAQTLEDILRQMTLDQYPCFPSIMEHISRHFVNLHSDERRYIFGWLRQVIRSCSLPEYELDSLPPEVASRLQAMKDTLLEGYACLSNSDPSFLAVYFQIQRWYTAPDDVGRWRCSPLEHLDRHIQFMSFLREVRDAMEAGTLDLPEMECSSKEFPVDVDHRIRDVSRFVIYLYGFNYYPQPTVDGAIQRIRSVYLAFTITEEAKTVLNPDEFNDFELVLEESMKILMKYGYGYDKRMSSDVLRKLSIIAEPHEHLMQLLMEIPWYHLQETDQSTTGQ